MSISMNLDYLYLYQYCKHSFSTEPTSRLNQAYASNHQVFQEQQDPPVQEQQRRQSTASSIGNG